jgi:predicted HTH transcriptional regulator
MNSMSDDALEVRLDKLIALFQLAFQSEIAEARRAILQDPVNEAILSLMDETPISAGELKARTKAKTGQSDRTIERRVADLVNQGALSQLGSGPRVTYRSTGLFRV